MLRRFAALCAFLEFGVAACGGGASPAMPKTYTPAQTAIIEYGSNACVTSYTVHDDGTAQRSYSSECPPQSSTSVTVPGAVVSKLFADLQAAQPLNALPRALTVDTSTQIAWNGQQTPNIRGAGAKSIEHTLMADVDTVVQVFPSQGAATPNPCGMPPPVPNPFLDLVSPLPGATNVNTSIGLLIFAGMPQGFYDNAQVTMTASSGVNVPVGAYTAAPSPSPTPYPVPSGWGGNVPYVAAPIPTLSPATTYSLSYTYLDFNGVPPSCTGPVTLPLGSFSTK